MKKKKTKIVATVSDMKCDVEFIKQLYEAGMNVIRLNTAHQTIDATMKILYNARQVSEDIALLLDTKGPEIRTTASDFKLDLKEGDEIKVKGDPEKSTDPECIYVTHKNFVSELDVNDRILIDDGDVELFVVAKEKSHLVCRAENSGIIKGRKSVNVPCVNFSLPALTEKDKEYIQFAIDNDITFIAHSFVRNKEDVLEVQKILDEKKSDVKIIAKIENQDGVNNLDEILQHVYGIMVARGDLAIEIPYEKIPGIQKKIINKCIDARKPVIIATQMLHSMIENPRPTRAEVTDVANAIYSKADAIMLSGETAYGEYPVKAVRTMARIAKEVEKSRGDYHKTPLVVLSTKNSAYLSKSAVEASIKLDAKSIIADTKTGRTILNMAGFRGRKPIFAQCYNKRVMRQLSLSFGVYANYLDPELAGNFVGNSVRNLLKSGILREDHTAVVLGGNFGSNVGASFIEIATIKNLLNRYKS